MTFPQDIESNAQLEFGAPSGPPSTRSAQAPRCLGWHSRGYLPHFDCPEVMQFITFRLADSLPQTVLDELERELSNVPENERSRERYRRVEHWLDQGLGCCALKHPRMAEVVQKSLLLFDSERYRLIDWCVMPNHVHVLIEPRMSLSKIIQSWKTFTGRWGLAHSAELELGVPGKNFWMREYFDRYIRDEEHFNKAVAYIHNNPVKAGLCAAPEDWPWSSVDFDRLTTAQFETESQEASII